MRAREQHWLVRFDIAETYRWYERQERGLGRRFNQELRAVLRRLPQDALLYALRFEDIRRVNLPSFPYGVFYFADESRVVILGVLHGARESAAELQQRRETYG
jgi:plasmid stabilization system protein ParE